MENAATRASAIPANIFSEEGKVDALTFQLQGTRYAIPISQVRYIEQITNHSRRVDTTDGPRELADYEGQAVPIVDFAALTHNKPRVKENLALIETLKQQEQDHIDWLNALEDAITNKTAFTMETDPHKCAFGQWYDSYTPDDDLLQDIMVDFDEPHRHIHALADQVLMLVEKDRQQEALDILHKEQRTTLAKLRHLFDMARDRLGSITRPVYVFVNAQHNRLMAIRLDAIDDIIIFDQKHFAPYETMQSASDLPVFAGYLSEDGQSHHPYILLDWMQFHS